MRALSHIFRSKRLNLRTLRESDAAQIASLAGDWDVARMTDRIPYPYSETDAMQWIDALPDNEQVFAIEHQGTLIGLCGVMKRTPGEAEIGYWIGKPWWGQGFATEAATGLVRYCFRNLSMARLTCCHYVDNPASAKVIEKLGFVKTGECLSWSDARRRDVRAIRYQLQRPRFVFLWRPVRRRRAA